MKFIAVTGIILLGLLVLFFTRDVKKVAFGKTIHFENSNFFSSISQDSVKIKTQDNVWEYEVFHFNSNVILVTSSGLVLYNGKIVDEINTDSRITCPLVSSKNLSKLSKDDIISKLGDYSGTDFSFENINFHITPSSGVTRIDEWGRKSFNSGLVGAFISSNEELFIWGKNYGSVTKIASVNIIIDEVNVTYLER